jgi:Fe-S-cluster containining protein
MESVTRPSRPNTQEAFLAAFQAGITEASATAIGTVYAQLDEHIRQATSVLPPLACKKGCCVCCFTSPIVTALEWQHLHEHLRTIPAERWAAIVDGAELVRPLVPELVGLFQAMQRGEPPFSIPIQCPFLIDGACSVYTARPLICRGFGATTMGGPAGEPTYFASNLAYAHAAKAFPPKFHLPALRPYLEQVRSLTDNARGLSAPLPLWLFAHLDGRELVAEVNLTPDFAALS